MQFTKFTAGLLTAAMAVTSLGEAVFAAPTAAYTPAQSDVIEGSLEQEAVYESPDQYHAYIGFQTSQYSFRNPWDDSYFGKRTDFFDHVVVWGDNDPETYPQYADKFSEDIGGSAGYVLDATYNDATIDKDGTYTVSISDFDWGLDGSTYFNWVEVSTDFYTDCGVVLSDAKLLMDGKVVIDAPGEIPMEDDIEDGTKVKAYLRQYFNSSNDSLSIVLINVWESILEQFTSGEYPTDELAVQFTVSGIDSSKSEPDDPYPDEPYPDAPEPDDPYPDEPYPDAPEPVDPSDTEAPPDTDDPSDTEPYEPDAPDTEAPPDFDKPETGNENDFAYIILDDGTAEIIDYTGNSTELVIPSTLGGKKLTSIGYEAFYGCSSLTSVTIPVGVTNISSGAFERCSNLTSINIPDGVTYIGGVAFGECSSLTSVDIPDSVTYIGEVAFYRTPLIDNQTTAVKYAGKWVVDCDTYATTAEIKSGTVGIASDAFDLCEKLTSISIPDTVAYMGYNAFTSCSSLTSITIPDSLTTLTFGAFQNCTSLTSITIPDSVTSVGGSVFNNTPLLDDQTTTVKYVGKWAIECDENATTATIKSGTVGIADDAFYEHSELTSITIPDSVKYIGEDAFRACSKLTSITIPYGVTSIRERTLYDCYDLNSIVIPDSVTQIGDWAFGFCYELNDIYYTGTQAQWDKITIGLKNGWLNSANVHYGFITAPSAVSGLKLKGRAADALRLSWTKNTSADGYIIEMKDGSKWVRVGKITKNSTVEFRKDKLKAGTAYNFRICAYKMNGKTALYSGYTSISARTNPSAVSGLKLKARTADTLRLSWTKNTSADGYIIEMKDGSKWVRVGKITSNSTVEFRKDKLKAGTAYSFRVKAYKMSGSTALYSGYTTISARTNPSAVTGLKLKARAADALRLTWAKNTSADGYIIEMKSGNSWTRVGKITKNSTIEFKKSGLKAGTAYTFRVKAYKMSGKTALYGATKTISVRTNPSAVSGLKLKASAKDAVRLAWTKNTSADGYIIEQKSGTKWVRVEKITNNSTAQFRKSGLKSKTSYTFRVKTYKMSGKTALYGATKTITVKTK